MLALTVLQPWATLIVLGHKTLETRTYSPRHLGRIAIHASSSPRGFDLAENCAPLVKFMNSQSLDIRSLPRGAVIGECEIVKVAGFEPSSDLSMHGWLANGGFTWHLSNATPYPTPITAMGFVRLWQWERPE